MFFRFVQESISIISFPNISIYDYSLGYLVSGVPWAPDVLGVPEAPRVPEAHDLTFEQLSKVKT